MKTVTLSNTPHDNALQTAIHKSKCDIERVMLFVIARPEASYAFLYRDVGSIPPYDKEDVNNKICVKKDGDSFYTVNKAEKIAFPKYFHMAFDKDLLEQYFREVVGYELIFDNSRRVTPLYKCVQSMYEAFNNILNCNLIRLVNEDCSKEDISKQKKYMYQKFRIIPTEIGVKFWLDHNAQQREENRHKLLVDLQKVVAAFALGATFASFWTAYETQIIADETRKIREQGSSPSTVIYKPSLSNQQSSSQIQGMQQTENSVSDIESSPTIRKLEPIPQ
ncbi:hypothetical protein [Pseudoalteromonas xiamenensis]